MIPAEKFYMIRHGQTEANAARIMAGSDDSPLTQTGIDQAHKARQVIEKLQEKPRVIIHSHLSRARDTATIINESLNVDMVEDPDFAELHAGDWEGVSYDECNGILDSWEDPPNGETFEQFFTRIKRAKNKALQAKHTPALIVCHGGVFRAFGKFYGLDIWGVRNCDIHEFTPNSMSQGFPWTATRYELCPEGSETLRSSLSDSYHADEIERKTSIA